MEDAMAESKAEERTRDMIEVLRRWQAIERESIEMTAQIMEETQNPLIRQIMEIIRNDSVQHHRVQQFMIDTMTMTPVNLTHEDLAEIWTKIEEHDKTEQEAIKVAKELRDKTTDHVHKILLDYLIRDEEKHDTILGELDEFKKHLSKLA
jgi:rubrerythrin